MIVINLFGGPGCGKSTAAAGLFYMMKNQGYLVELVTEYAKEIVWADRHTELGDQLYILAKQHHKLHLIKEKVDFAITDSPLLLINTYSKLYNRIPSKNFFTFVSDLNEMFDNRYVILERVKSYSDVGRVETLEQAMHIDALIKSELEIQLGNNISKVLTTPGDLQAPVKILNWLKENS